MNADHRNLIYRNLHSHQALEEEKRTAHAAAMILRIIGRYIQPKSMLDVGCGLGSWINSAKEHGIGDVLGIEGPWLNLDLAVVDRSLIRIADLEQPFNLGRRFDLVVCLEVAEHISLASASDFISSLVAHGDCILFSAAVPHQGGHGHINEQFLSYWIELFSKHGYLPVDVVRGEIWEDQSILWYLRQNCILFCSSQLLDSNASLQAQSKIVRPLSIILPDVYSVFIRRTTRGVETSLAEYEQLRQLLAGGGQFSVEASPNGSLAVTRLP